MAHIIRETAFGQMVRWISRNKVFQYPEETEGFELPAQYSSDADDKILERIATALSQHGAGNALEKESSSGDDTPDEADIERALALARSTSTVYSRPYTEARFIAEQQLELAKQKSIPILPQRTADGVILVDWYTTDDPANPQNWSCVWKALVVVVMCVYTWIMYCASSIIAPAEAGMIEEFNISPEAALVPFALFVIGYGVGPLVFGPLSEIPVIGRNAVSAASTLETNELLLTVPQVYASTFALFFALSFPTAVVNSFAGLCVLRLLTGIFSSPAVTIAGATFSDMYTLMYVPYQLGWWVFSAWGGPAIGFLMAGFAVSARNWHWALWEIVWMSALVAVLLFFFSPETSAANILLRRARRLRKLTGNSKLCSQSEIDQSNLSASTVLSHALIKPIEIMIKDPAILFVNTYTALFYGIYYTFFEAFPVVFQGMHGFNLGETGLAFLACQVGATVGLLLYFAYLKWYMVPDNKKNGFREQEHRLIPAIFGSWILPVGLFMFAFTAKEDIHWIVPLIGVVIFVTGFFTVMQGLFVYLPLSYPQYAASLFSGNDVCRSTFAAGAILFARPMFINLGVARGVALLGGLTGMGIIGMLWLYIYGKRLRAMSRFAQG